MSHRRRATAARIWAPSHAPWGLHKDRTWEKNCFCLEALKSCAVSVCQDREKDHHHLDSLCCSVSLLAFLCAQPSCDAALSWVSASLLPDSGRPWWELTLCLVLPSSFYQGHVGPEDLLMLLQSVLSSYNYKVKYKNWKGFCLNFHFNRAKS